MDDLDDVAGEAGRELAERYARRHEVRAALNRLPDEQREIRVLDYFGLFSQSEIATHRTFRLAPSRPGPSGGLRRLAKLISRNQ